MKWEEQKVNYCRVARETLLVYTVFIQGLETAAKMKENHN